MKMSSFIKLLEVKISSETRLAEVVAEITFASSSGSSAPELLLTVDMMLRKLRYIVPSDRIYLDKIQEYHN